MGVFSTNQVRHIYVLGDTHKLTFKKDSQGNLFGIYDKGAVTPLKTDYINPKSVTHVALSDTNTMADHLKAVKLTFDDTTTHPISGQDYIVRINFRQFYGMSDEDIYQKYGAVHATAAMKATPALFWKELAYSLVKNFSKTYADYLHFYVGTKQIAKAVKKGTTITLKDADGKELTPTDGITIAEASQLGEWSLGKGIPSRVQFEVIPTQVYNNEDNGLISWGTVTEDKTVEALDEMKIANGYKLAELEWFLMGERGDQYRQLYWPKNIETKYLVDATKEYYTLDIHYAYQGSCEDIQKSEKDILIIAEDNAPLETILTQLTSNGVSADVTYKVVGDDGSIETTETSGAKANTIQEED